MSYRFINTIFQRVITLFPSRCILTFPSSYILVCGQMVCSYPFNSTRRQNSIPQAISCPTKGLIPDWFSLLCLHCVAVFWVLCDMPLQECKTLHFPLKTVEMPNTDALPYLMYKGMRRALADLKDSLDETLEREFNRVSDKGMSLLQLITTNVIIFIVTTVWTLLIICLFAFIVISLKEASNRNTSERTRGMSFCQVVSLLNPSLWTATVPS